MFRTILLLSLLSFSEVAKAAETSTAALCDAAATIAAKEADLPPDMMRALTRAETGRARGGQLTPWPWTVNMEGKGLWFDTKDEALAYVTKHKKRGAVSFDVGCFQINYRWHKDAFSSTAQSFDPLINARYAARYLLSLKAEGGSWSQVIGRYHSRTPARARKYAGRVARIRSQLVPVSRVAILPVSPDIRPVPAPYNQPKPTSHRPNSYPGGVALSSFSQAVSLLTPARPLFE